jgi:hypothetical protein
MILQCPRELALAHLMLRLRPLHRALDKAIAQRDANARTLFEAGAIGAAITRGHVTALLEQLGSGEPHALATGPALPPRCRRACTTICRRPSAPPSTT